MISLSVILSLIFASIFFLAAVMKLNNLEESVPFVKSVVPRIKSPKAVVIVVSAVEFCIAVAILIPTTYLTAMVSGILILMGFCVIIEIQIRNGIDVPCNCFGRLSKGRLTRFVEARNGAFAVVGIAGITSAQGISPFRSFSLGGNSLIWGTIAALSLITVGNLLLNLFLLKSFSDLSRVAKAQTQPSFEGPPMGTLFPEVIGYTTDQNRIDILAPPSSARTLALIFVSTTCEACREIFSEFEMIKKISSADSIFLLCSGSHESFSAIASEYSFDELFLHIPSTTLEEMQIPATPSALIIDQDGRVITDTSVGIAAITSLVQTFSGREAA